MSTVSEMVSVRVELFGMPRVKAGCSHVSLELEPAVSTASVVRKLAEACPVLGETALDVRSGRLKEGYIFNLNGLAFLDDEGFAVSDGDCLLLLSNQAGG